MSVLSRSQAAFGKVSKPRRRLPAKAGFSLPEALIASAIAASVVAASASSIAVSLRASQTGSAALAAMREAENITARLEAGADIQEFLEPNGAWRLTETVFEDIDPRRDEPVLMQVTLTHERFVNMNFSVLAIRPDNGEPR